MKISDDSKDTIRRLQLIRDEPCRPGETHVQKFDRIMGDKSFGTELNRLANEPEEVWIKKLDDAFGPKSKKFFIVK